MEKLTTGTASARSAWDTRAIEPGQPVKRNSHEGGQSHTETGRNKTPAAPVDLTTQVEAIERMRAELDSNGRAQLKIDRDGDAGHFIYRIKDPETGRTVRQWPPETYLDLINFLRSQQGGLVDERA